MSLANLTLQGMDRYGAIELRQYADRYVARGFMTAVSLVGFVFLFYFIIPEKNVVKQDIPIIRSLAELASPPSLKQNTVEPMSIAAPAIDAAKPTFGIPVPVPNLKEVYLPDIIDQPVASITPIGTVGVPGGTVIITPVKEEVRKTIVDDDPDVFIYADQQPELVTDIQSLVRYPEIARRAGLEGRVLISALVDVDGSVIRTRIEQADYEVFKQPSIDAVMKSKFTPALQDKEPVRLWVTIPISFRINDK